jgi:hypothetical protein
LPNALLYRRRHWCPLQESMYHHLIVAIHSLLMKQQINQSIEHERCQHDLAMNEACQGKGLSTLHASRGKRSPQVEMVGERSGGKDRRGHGWVPM